MRTNILVCLTIVAGFLLTAFFGYRANYSVALENIEQVSALTSEGIYYQMRGIFMKPVNISLTMANDSLLREYLSAESAHLTDPAYVRTLGEYLKAYQKKYGYDSVFLVSALTERYYNFNGVDRVLTRGDPENDWYYALKEAREEYAVNIDNDEAKNAGNEVTLFVNCKIKDASGTLLGIVGVGFRVGGLQELLREYEDKFGVSAYLIDGRGVIEVSTNHTGYESVDLFAAKGLRSAREEIIAWKEANAAQSLWAARADGAAERDYLVTRYIPELSWHLVVERDTTTLLAQFRRQLFQSAAVVGVIILIILLVITYVIRSFNRQILMLTKEREETFRKVTEELYDNIYEVNVTQNRAAGVSTKRYFESLGATRDMPYDAALRMIAAKQIGAEFREGYVAAFSPENVLAQYAAGNTQLRYDFMMSREGDAYFWMRIDAHVYRCREDDTIRMFVYHKNIDAEKRKEIAAKRKMQTDEMTGLYTKSATQKYISKALEEYPERQFAFYILDIDNFKQANDRYGHAFGDFVIGEFTAIIRSHFQAEDIIGRIGGDEFVVFVSLPDEGWAVRKAEQLSGALHRVCSDSVKCWRMSASIGVAVAPRDGADFVTLYKNADSALYQAKQRGKNGFALFARAPQ